MHVSKQKSEKLSQLYTNDKTEEIITNLFALKVQSSQSMMSMVYM